ncbi:hypothetical protein LCGC14_0588060 [marine sediment metagenome]|uniref:Uncharacterized protein n=1 Tax=marine sediment metagenome TaxID=412755 RepID=A0A0F9UMR5_9ZZZZ
MSDLAEPIDVQIDGERYAVYTEVVKGVADIAFKRIKDEPLSRSAKGAIPVLWEDGLSGGMGYGRAIKGGPTDAYAHTVGVDNHLPGLMRLHGRRVSVSPGKPPVDANTDFFESTQTTAQAEFFCGSFTKDTNAGIVTQSSVSHGLAEKPRVMLFWWSDQTVSGTVAAGDSAGWGIMSRTPFDNITGRTASWASEDNVGTSNAARKIAGIAAPANVSIAFISPSGADGPHGVITNLGTSTLDIDWTDNNTDAAIIHFLAIGGPGVEATLSAWALQTSAGAKSVTGVGFQPDVCIHLSASLNSTTSASDAKMTMGVMDASGNQWSTSIYSQDAQGASNTLSGSSGALCLNGIDSAGSAVTQSFVSMDSDGFTTSGLANANDIVMTLSIKGVRALAGKFTKKTSSGNQAAQTIGFTTEAFMVASTQDTLLGGTSDNHARFSLGGASATDEVEAMCWTDEDGQATTDVYGLSDTALAFEMTDVTDGSEDSTATCGDIDMETAGFLNWGAATGSAEYIFYLALASAENVTFMYGASGQRTTKMSIADNVITVEEQVDHGNDASIGYGTEFEAVQYQPLGKGANAVKLTAVTSSTGDTWGDAGHTAVAYTTQQDGPDAKLAKGYSASATTIANLVALSSDGSTFAGGWEIGDLTTDIVRMTDSGTSFYIGKEDNLYRADPTRVSEKITSETDASPSHGTGTVAVQGTDVAIYNHGSSEFFFTGGRRPDNISIDTNPFNQPIDNITHEPVTGTYLEADIVGDWKYNLYAVTESSTTKTYVLASYWIAQLGKWIPHSYDRLDGWARGMKVDSEFRLWTANNGTYLYYQLGKDGSPDAGRDNIGFGAASTTYYCYLPEIDAGLEVTQKRLWQFFILTRNIDTTCPVQLIVHRDGGAEEAVGPTVRTSGLSKRYWTAKDTATRFRLGWKVVTTASYTPASSDPQVLVLGSRVKSQADTAGAYDIMIDTGVAYEDDEPQATQEAKDIRDALLALVNDKAVAVTDPQGNSLTLWFLDVSDFLLRGPNDDKKVHYIVRCQAEERTTPS